MRTPLIQLSAVLPLCGRTGMPILQRQAGAAMGRGPVLSWMAQKAQKLCGSRRGYSPPQEPSNSRVLPAALEGRRHWRGSHCGLDAQLEGGNLCRVICRMGRPRNYAYCLPHSAAARAQRAQHTGTALTGSDNEVVRPAPDYCEIVPKSVATAACAERLTKRQSVARRTMCASPMQCCEATGMPSASSRTQGPIAHALQLPAPQLSSSQPMHIVLLPSAAVDRTAMSAGAEQGGAAGRVGGCGCIQAWLGGGTCRTCIVAGTSRRAAAAASRQLDAVHGCSGHPPAGAGAAGAPCGVQRGARQVCKPRRTPPGREGHTSTSMPRREAAAELGKAAGRGSKPALT